MYDELLLPEPGVHEVEVQPGFLKYLSKNAYRR